MEWKKKRERIFINNNNKPTLSHSLFIIIIFFTTTVASTITSTTCSDMKSCPSAGRKYFQELSRDKIDKNLSNEHEMVQHLRNLGGVGSSPPRCLWKCGSCTPCKPVHVPVPPGTPVTAEYYPEAWRCKCGNKLYMP